MFALLDGRRWIAAGRGSSRQICEEIPEGFPGETPTGFPEASLEIDAEIIDEQPEVLEERTEVPEESLPIPEEIPGELSKFPEEMFWIFSQPFSPPSPEHLEISASSGIFSSGDLWICSLEFLVDILSTCRFLVCISSRQQAMSSFEVLLFEFVKDIGVRFAYFESILRRGTVDDVEYGNELRRELRRSLISFWWRIDEDGDWCRRESPVNLSGSFSFYRKN